MAPIQQQKELFTGLSNQHVHPEETAQPANWSEQFQEDLKKQLKDRWMRTTARYPILDQTASAREQIDRNRTIEI